MGRNSEPRETGEFRCDWTACSKVPWCRITFLLCSAASVDKSKVNSGCSNCGSGVEIISLIISTMLLGLFLIV